MRFNLRLNIYWHKPIACDYRHLSLKFMLNKFYTSEKQYKNQTACKKDVD